MAKKARGRSQRGKRVAVSKRAAKPARKVAAKRSGAPKSGTKRAHQGASASAVGGMRRRSTLPSRGPAQCSFCGKPEHEVGRLICGGGEQPNAVLPIVNICNECVALCNRILLDRPSPRQTPWNLFITKGEQFEWAAFTQDDGAIFMMVRRFQNDRKSFGLVLEAGDQPSTDLARETVLKVPEYF